MSIGSLVYQVRSRFGHGLRTAYWRDVVRPRILTTEPVRGTTDRACEIHALTSQNDWLNLTWTLKSFYASSQRRYALCIHDDGSLEPQQVQILRYHFPDARMIARQQADADLAAVLADYPRCLQFRRSNQLAPKLFDFAAHLQSERMLLLDSDILFFSTPTELLRRIEDPVYRLNSVNADVNSAYTVEPAEVLERCHVRMIARFNSGLGLIHRESLRLDWLEEFLAMPGILGHFWRIEQTLFALCSSRFGVQLLPPEYDVRLTGAIGASPCRHYVGAIRPRMYREGMRRLTRCGFLRRRPLGPDKYLTGRRG